MFQLKVRLDRNERHKYIHLLEIHFKDMYKLMEHERMESDIPGKWHKLMWLYQFQKK